MFTRWVKNLVRTKTELTGEAILDWQASDGQKLDWKCNVFCKHICHNKCIIMSLLCFQFDPEPPSKTKHYYCCFNGAIILYVGSRVLTLLHSNKMQWLLMLLVMSQYVLCEKGILADIHKLTFYFPGPLNLRPRHILQGFLQLIITVIINRICITICWTVIFYSANSAVVPQSVVNKRTCSANNWIMT